MYNLFVVLWVSVVKKKWCSELFVFYSTLLLLFIFYRLPNFLGLSLCLTSFAEF